MRYCRPGPDLHFLTCLQAFTHNFSPLPDVNITQDYMFLHVGRVYTWFMWSDFYLGYSLCTYRYNFNHWMDIRTILSYGYLCSTSPFLPCYFWLTHHTYFLKLFHLWFRLILIFCFATRHVFSQQCAIFSLFSKASKNNYLLES